MRSKLLVLSSLFLLLASCTPTYIVTFSGSTGGSVSNMGGEYDEGATVSVSAQPETGYEFIGWSDGSSQNPRTISVSENLNLTALFSKQQFSVSVTTQGEGTVATSGATGQGSFEYGSSARFEAVPAEGWYFDSWTGDATGNNNPITISVDGPKSITAVFKRKQFDLTVTVEGEGTVTEQVIVQPGQYDYETQVKLTATAQEGWTFAGWTGDVASTENPVMVTVTEAKEITATFIRKKYDLTVTVQGEGTVEETVVIQPGQYDYETQVKLTATAEEGWEFAGWTGDIESTENPVTVTITEAKEVTAAFIRKKYDLNITIEGEGTVKEEVIVQPGQYDYETVVRLTAIPTGGWTFASWTGDVESEELVIEVPIEKVTSLTAVFRPIQIESFISTVKLVHPWTYEFLLGKPYNESDIYKIGPSGWLSVSNQESHEAYYYPTSSDYNPAGYFTLDPHNFALGDYNGDGLQDVLITWATFPHTILRESKFTYTFLINNGDGTLSYDENIITSPSIQNRHFAYRTIAADFNGDNIDDIVSASMGLIKRLPDGGYFTKWESIPLMLSNGIGSYYDASTNIEGQEDGVSPPQGHSFGHEISVGDVDGDGDNDIFTGKTLLLNDGRGYFKNETDKLPNELRPGGRNIWSSVIADFNNDGVDDFFVPYAETTSNSFSDAYEDYSGAYYISVNGGSDLEGRRVGFVTEAKYGISNTKFNYAIAYDVNLDGFKDIVIATTRAEPYYVGKGLQIFLNEYNEETQSRKFVSGDHLLPNEAVLDQTHGEGQLTAIDINNDGVLDIAHTSGAYGEDYGISLYLNIGGSLQMVPMDKLVYLTDNQTKERENFGVYDKLRRAIPINLNNSGWIDMISTVGFGNSDGRGELIFYSILSKE